MIIIIYLICIRCSFCFLIAARKTPIVAYTHTMKIRFIPCLSTPRLRGAFGPVSHHLVGGDFLFFYVSAKYYTCWIKYIVRLLIIIIISFTGSEKVSIGAMHIFPSERALYGITGIGDKF